MRVTCINSYYAVRPWQAQGIPVKFLPHQTQLACTQTWIYDKKKMQFTQPPSP